MKSILSRLLALTVVALSLVGCNLGNDEPPFEPQSYTVSGKVEKGPFVSGSTITMQRLDGNLQSIGEMYTTTIVDNEGSFTFGAKSFDTPYADLSANGYFFNEVRGELSTGTLNLRAIVDISDATTVNVNILTHIKYQRLLNLVAAGKSFSDANAQAQQELFGAFGCSQYADIEASRLSIISGDEKAGVLIAISSLLLVERSEAELTEYLARLCREFAAEGEFSAATQEIIDADLDELVGRLEEIRENIIRRYADLGMEIEVPELKHYFDWDGDGLAGEEGYNYITPEVTPSNPESMLSSLYADETNAMGVPLLANDGQMIVASMAMELAKAIEIFNTAQQFYHFNKEVGNLVSQNIRADQASIFNCWNSFYKSINTRLLLEYADRTMRDCYQGYCKVFSAMQYYYMTTMWGDVPYIAEYNSGELQPSRTDANLILMKLKEQLLEAIENDLEEKKNNSLGDANEFFFASKDVARVLLAEVALAMNDYELARIMLDAVINASFYKVTDANFSDLASISGANAQEEMIFAMHNANTNTTRATIQSSPIIPVQTYTEVMLLYAEVCYYLGDKEKAQQAIDEVAIAKGLALEGDNLLQKVTQARKQLLLYSLGNFAYMKRNNLIEEEYGVESYYQLFPIPDSELLFNPNMMQNPGY